MGVKNFVINHKHNPIPVTAGDARQMEYTIEFDNGVHPNKLTLRYDIDASGQGFGVTFDNGKFSVSNPVDTPDLLNDTVEDSFTLNNGQNGQFGIDISIVASGETNNIVVNYTS